MLIMRECQRVHNNDYRKHLKALVWLGRMMALHSVSVGVVSSYSGMQPQQQQSVCGPTARGTCSRACTKPSGLLMVHAVLTLAVNVWLCGMTGGHINQPPKLYT